MEETDTESYKDIFKAKKCTRIGFNGKVVTLTLLPALFLVCPFVHPLLGPNQRLIPSPQSSNRTGKSFFIEHPNAGQRAPEDVQTRRVMTTTQHYHLFAETREDYYAPSLKSRTRSASTSSTDTACTSSTRSSDTACSMSTWSGETVCSSSTWSGETVCSSPTWSSDSDTLYGWSVYLSDSE